MCSFRNLFFSLAKEQKIFFSKEQINIFIQTDTYVTAIKDTNVSDTIFITISLSTI